MRALFETFAPRNQSEAACDDVVRHCATDASAQFSQPNHGPALSDRRLHLDRLVDDNLEVVSAAAGVGGEVRANSLFLLQNSLIYQVTFPVSLGREFLKKSRQYKLFSASSLTLEPRNREFPCKIPCLQGIRAETGAISTGPPANQPQSSRVGWRQTPRVASSSSVRRFAAVAWT